MVVMNGSRMLHGIFVRWVELCRGVDVVVTVSGVGGREREGVSFRAQASTTPDPCLVGTYA